MGKGVLSLPLCISLYTPNCATVIPRCSPAFPFHYSRRYSQWRGFSRFTATLYTARYKSTRHSCRSSWCSFRRLRYTEPDLRCTRIASGSALLPLLAQLLFFCTRIPTFRTFPACIRWERVISLDDSRNEWTTNHFLLVAIEQKGARNFF